MILEVLTAVLLRLYLSLSLSVNDNDDVGPTILKNDGNYSLNNTSSQPGRI
jgi:hypothetical protein